MFDFGLGELLLVGVVALIVLGPERLPQAARTAGRLVGKLQGFVNNVKQELNTQAELDELRKVKQEFEAAASEFRDGIKDLGDDAQKNLNDISDGILYLMQTRTAETALTPAASDKFFDTFEMRLHDWHDDHLRDTLERLDGKRFTAPVP